MKVAIVISSMNVINGDLISGDDHVTRSWSLSIIIIEKHDKDQVTPTGENESRQNTPPIV